MGDIIGKVESAKEDMGGLTVKIKLDPSVDIKKIFDYYYNKRMVPSVALLAGRTDYTDYTGFFDIGKPATHLEWKSSGTIHLTGYSHNIVGIYVNRKKELVTIKWSDGEITKVHRRKGDKFDLEAAVNAAIVKRLISSHTEYQKKIEAITEYQN